eukprot:TRINITY_DN9438_c0_g1_i2.p1 TRINITY_DN9438_c0_g1~~TRINITY_DN9438_c0_g1_i2.p1  ORF type:complete len:130 (+),score=19.85 TRINITY_DN9438_c0_g1_i2:656-1045(+)
MMLKRLRMCLSEELFRKVPAKLVLDTRIGVLLYKLREHMKMYPDLLDVVNRTIDIIKRTAYQELFEPDAVGAINREEKTHIAFGKKANEDACNTELKETFYEKDTELARKVRDRICIELMSVNLRTTFR